MPAAAMPAWVRDFQPDPLWEPVRALRWSHDDFSLLAMTVEHRRWIKQLAAGLALETVDNGVLPAALDGGDCRFGHWLKGHEEQRYSEIEAFQTMNAIHQNVHDRGKMLVDWHRAGQVEQARAGLPEVQELSRQLQECLQAVLIAIAKPQ